MQGVALGLEEQPVELFVFAAVELQLHSFLPVEARQIDIGSMLKDLWLVLALGMTQNAVAVVQVTVQLHVTYGCEAVEPRIGHRLHDLLEAIAPDLFFQTLTRDGHIAGKGAGPDQGHIALLYNRLNALGGQAVKRRSPGHSRDKIAPGLLGIGFEVVAIHAVLASV